MVKVAPPNPWWVKIADFGISKQFERTAGLSPSRGTFGYMAPELFGFGEPNELSNLQKAQKADIWSVGEILHFMLTLDHTFGDDLEGLRTYAQEGTDFPSHVLESQGVTAGGIKFVQYLMNHLPQMRPAPEATVSDAWVATNNAYDGMTVRLYHTIRCRETTEPFMVFSWDGKNLLTVTSHKLYLIDVATGKLVKSYSDKQRGFIAAAFSPDDQFVMILDKCGSLTRMTADALEIVEEQLFTLGIAGECFVTYSQDGRCVATAHQGNVFLWTLDKAALPVQVNHRNIRSHVRSLAFTTDGKSLLVAIDRLVVRMAVGNGKDLDIEEKIPYPMSGPLSGISPDGSKFVHCTEKDMYLWQEGCWRWQYRFKKDGVQSIQFSPTNNSVISTHRDGSITLWKAAGIDQTGSVSFREENATSMAMSPQRGEFMAIKSVDAKGGKIVIRKVAGA
jgi:WD40 repeat protein